MEMHKLVAHESDGCRLILLLDVHMEGIEQYPGRWGVKPVDDLHDLFRSVEKARLKAVERLDTESHPALRGVVDQRSQSLNQPVDRGCTFGGVHLPGLADRGVDGTSDDIPAERRDRIN